MGWPPGQNGAGERGVAARRETKIVVFPQGSQRKGMGKDLFDAYPSGVAEADEILGYSASQAVPRRPEGRAQL